MMARAGHTPDSQIGLKEVSGEVRESVQKGWRHQARKIKGTSTGTGRAARSVR